MQTITSPFIPKEPISPPKNHSRRSISSNNLGSFSSLIPYKHLMGISMSGQQLERFKHERIDKIHLLKMVRNIKTEEDIEIAIKNLISIMTVKQKLGQLQQWSYGQDTLSPALIKHIADGGVGAFLNVWKLQNVNLIQKIAMEQSRLKIPLLIARDVIHGYKTVFPIPLGQAASFNPDLLEQTSRIAAIQASSDGINWTYTPMVDIARDPRWGRIAEGFGQDHYLSGVMGAAVVRGLHGKDLKDKTAVAACGKHLVGYGASEGGKDYNTCYIPEASLRDNYLPPFKALKQSGCLTFMTAFTDLNGQPCAANDFILKTIIRDQWGFDGVVVSDYTAVTEMINQGFVENAWDAARRAFNGGLDIEMTSFSFYQNIEDLLSKKLVSMTDLNTKVARVLRMKFRMNLFQNYYTDPSRMSILLHPTHKELAKQQAIQCPVLLQNKHSVLPIRKNVKTLAVIGKLADDPENQIGCWAPDGKAKDCITPLTSLRETLTTTKVMYAQGYKQTRSFDKSHIAEAVSVATHADVVLLFLGEDNWLTGESNNRANLNLPGIQDELIVQIAKTGKPIAAVIYAGRSILLQHVMPYADSILFAWQLGTMTGPALTELLIGKVSPSGKLPITFPRHGGQVPLYYNYKFTGRPNETNAYIPYTVGYIDIDQTPLFPFGFGLSYTTFSYSNIQLSKNAIAFGECMVASATITNQGTVEADEIVFLFVRDLVGSYTRPAKQLKDFQRVTLSPGESKTVSFMLTSDKLKFWTKDKQQKAEPGKFHLWIARNASDGLHATFELLPAEAEYETL